MTFAPYQLSQRSKHLRFRELLQLAAQCIVVFANSLGQKSGAVHSQRLVIGRYVAYRNHAISSHSSPTDPVHFRPSRPLR
jgi:hypothetical protein